jgi:branched-chain amino acid transport system permease protein
MATIVQLVLNSLVAGAGYGLLAVSFAVVYNVTHFYNFSQAAVYTIAAYIAFTFLTVMSGGVPFAVLGAVLGAGLLGGLMELIVYTRIRARTGSPDILLLTSLGLLVALQNCVSLVFGDEVKMLGGWNPREGFSFFGGRITGIQATTVVVCFVFYTAVAWGLHHTSFGKALRAVGSDATLATSCGVNSSQIIIGASFVGSALVGMVAVLAAYDTGLQPTMGFNALLMGIVGMIVGGIGTITGAFVGGLVIGFVQQVSAWLLPSKWQDAIVFLTLMLVLLLRPQGILGSAARRRDV